MIGLLSLSDCKSCIVPYLARNPYCPKCGTMTLLKNSKHIRYVRHDVTSRVSVQMLWLMMNDIERLYDTYARW